MSNETINKTFDCSENASLALSNIRGKVNIQPGEDNVITIKAEKLLDSGDPEQTVIELSQDNNGKVTAQTRFDNSGFQIFRKFKPCKVNYDVRVPKNCFLKVRGVSNTANIDGITGDLDISTVSGDIQIRSLNGHLKIKTVSGDIQGEDIGAAARIETVSGDFHLNRCNFPSLRGKTVSGDLILETALGDGPYSFNAVSGDIKIEINPLSGASIISSSLSGEIRASIPVSWSNRSRNHQKVEVNGGGVEINHKSVSGDLFLTTADESGPSEERPPQETAQIDQLSHTEILDSIERGEMNVDEAVGMIEKVNGG
jgi:DUF4097 and DUF4098 domain-containing protein YvlB